MMINLNNIPLAEFPRTYDISPGEYALDIFYSDVSEAHKTRYITSGRSNTLLHAQSGHIYFIYPSFPSKRKWELKIVDFDKLDDLSSFSQDFWSDIEDGKRIKERVEQHFKMKHNHSLRVSGRKHWE